jgi:hypothetical protein
MNFLLKQNLMSFVHQNLLTFANMQNATFKILSIFLCGLLIYNSLGYFIVFSVTRLAIRQQTWTQIVNISDKQLTTYVFNKNGPDSRLKIINNHEIIVDGKLYDVARKVNSGSSIIYHCVRDAKEQSLIAKTRLINSESQTMPVKNTARLIIEKIITIALINNTKLFIEHTICKYSLVKETTSYTGPEISILHPPPKSFC